MTRSQIISIVKARTENKLTEAVDFNDLFTDVLQEFCAEHRFWWLKKRLTFSTAASTPTYDLTAVTTAPANAGPYVDEIIKVILIDSSGNECPLTPIFDAEAIVSMATDSTSAQPASWTVETNDLTAYQTLRLSKIPNGIYTVHVVFWAMPNPAADSSDDSITLVPATKHHILKTALEKEVWRLAYGEQDPKFKTALELYNKKVAQAKIRPSFSAQKEVYFSNQQEEAIRSTR